MNDRELLELAAKAAGYGGRIRACVTGLQFDLIVDDNDKEWNPLTDDGDALRLAVKLNINPMQYPVYTKEKHSALAVMHIDIKNDESSCVTYQSCGGDPLTATRRAIAQCAAEIGKAMT